MSADEHELRAAWSRCVGDIHDAWVLFDSLLGRHREPHRHYHGVRHVTWVVRHVEELAAAEPVDDIGGGRRRGVLPRRRLRPAGPPTTRPPAPGSPTASSPRSGGMAPGGSA